METSITRSFVKQLIILSTKSVFFRFLVSLIFAELFYCFIQLIPETAVVFEKIPCCLTNRELLILIHQVLILWVSLFKDHLIIFIFTKTSLCCQAWCELSISSFAFSCNSTKGFVEVNQRISLNKKSNSRND
jgi:hypothetical protein